MDVCYIFEETMTMHELSERQLLGITEIAEHWCDMTFMEGLEDMH